MNRCRTGVGPARPCFQFVLLLLTVALAIPPLARAQAPTEAGLERLNLPTGFHISRYAKVPGARSLAYDAYSQTLFVGTRSHEVYAVRDQDGDHHGETVITLLDHLDVPNGVAVHDGYLFIATQTRILRYPLPGQPVADDWPRQRYLVYRDLPDKAHHGWRYIAFGPDGKLYVTVGSPCNICEVHGQEGTIQRMDPDGAHAETFARGIRNSVGMAFQPGTGVLYFTDNGTDGMGDNSPPDELNAADRPGLNFGFPWYAGGHDRHPQWRDERPPTEVTFPVVAFQAHTANLGLRFYQGHLFPAEYRNDALVAEHGSWDRSVPIGYRIMRVTFRNHVAQKAQVFIDGWLQDGSAWGRPVDLLELPDGSLLISDDAGGMVYRLTYGH